LEPVRTDDNVPDASGNPEQDFAGPVQEFPRPSTSPYTTWVEAPKFQNRLWLHALLFLLTVGSTALTGGWVYCVTILAILGCHEFGHYFMCRYYRVDASLPYFLPFPLALTGTLGAFIRIREPIRSKRMFFDIGIAGPIAGFLVALPALFIGVYLSQMAPIEGDGIWLGEPLLFKIASRLLWGRMPDGQTLILHPIGFGAWFGLLATALNLFPFGQLDGGHIAYAVLGRRSTYVTLATVFAAIALSYASISWRAWTVLMMVMLFVFGARHPRTFDEHEPLDAPRLALAAFAAVIFALCFTPVPIERLIPR
jgi:membrane-associated protease RseP (regulator of RpoE activity)